MIQTPVQFGSDNRSKFIRQATLTQNNFVGGSTVKFINVLKLKIMEKVTPKEIIDLVKKLPDADSHIHEWAGKQCITNEWLVGNFAGSSFEANTLEDAAQMLIDYLYQHIGHKSMVGSSVTGSGFPNLESVERYCRRFENVEE